MFDPATPVVDFVPTSHPHRVANQRWFLWPALAWRVVVPEPRRAAFNAFQHAILSLCRAGVRSGGDIAERLCLPEDLVRFVIEQLQGTGMLDEHGAPTVLAIRRMEEEEEPGGPECAGYVFVDAHSGRLWPRFHPGSLPFVVAEVDGRHGRFERGKTGNRRTVNAAVFWPQRNLRTPPPSPQQILAAVRQDSRRRRAFAMEGGGRDDEEQAPLDHRAIKRIRRLGTEPEPVLVLGTFFVPADAPNPVWLATDPLGLGVTSLLQAEAVRLAEADHSRVREVIEALMGEAFHIDAADAAAFQREVVERAVARIRGALGVDAHGVPHGVLMHLAEAEEHLERARQSARSARLVDDFLGRAWAALEELFGWLVRLYGDPTLAGALEPSAEENVRILTQVAGRLGFDVPPRVSGIFRLPRSVVQRALRSHDAPLNARLAAVLLAAERDSSHPFRTVALAFPLGVAFLSDFGLRRNEGSHQGDAGVQLAAAEAIHDGLFHLLRALLGEGTGPGGEASGWSELGWGAGLRLRLRGQAEQAVRRYDGAEERPELRARLIEMHEAAILLDLLRASGQLAPREMSGRVRDLVVAGAIAAEGAIAEFARAVPCDRSVAPAPGARKDPVAVTRAAEALGFSADEKGEVPGAIASARPDRIREAASGRRATLSAMVVAQLLTAARHENHPLRRVAERSPTFVLDLASIVQARGHAGTVTLEADDAPRFLETVGGVATVVLAVLDETET